MSERQGTSKSDAVTIGIALLTLFPVVLGVIYGLEGLKRKANHDITAWGGAVAVFIAFHLTLALCVLMVIWNFRTSGRVSKRFILLSITELALLGGFILLLESGW